MRILKAAGWAIGGIGLAAYGIVAGLVNRSIHAPHAQYRVLHGGAAVFVGILHLVFGIGCLYVSVAALRGQDDEG